MRRVRSGWVLQQRLSFGMPSNRTEILNEVGFAPRTTNSFSPLTHFWDLYVCVYTGVFFPFSQHMKQLLRFGIDHVICHDELKMAMLACGTLCPAFLPFVINAMRSTNDEAADFVQHSR